MAALTCQGIRAGATNVPCAQSFQQKKQLSSNLAVQDSLSFQEFSGLRMERSTRMAGCSSSGSTGQPQRRRLSAAATIAEPAVAPEITVPKQKIRIKLRSYWTNLIEQALAQVLEAAKTTGAKVTGPVPLPTKKRIWCVLRSPHVNKDSREHFELRTHRRLVDLENPTAQTIDALMQLSLPAGVDVEVKLS